MRRWKELGQTRGWVDAGRYGQKMLEGMRERCVSTLEMSVDCRAMEEPVRLVEEGVQEEESSSQA